MCLNKNAGNFTNSLLTSDAKPSTNPMIDSALLVCHHGLSSLVKIVRINRVRTIIFVNSYKWLVRVSFNLMLLSYPDYKQVFCLKVN